MAISLPPIFFSNLTASIIDQKQGKYTFIFEDPVSYPPNTTIALSSFNFINYFYNISTDKKNNTIYFSDDKMNDEKYSITIPNGYYSVDELSEFIGYAINDLLGLSIFQLIPFNASNKVGILFDGINTGWYVNFKANETPYEILGFTSGQYVPANQSSTANEIVLGSIQATMSPVSGIKIGCSLISMSISGTTRSNVLYQSGIRVPPSGSQSEQPFNLLRVPSSFLNSDISQIIIYFYDTAGNSIEMLEDWNMTLSLEYFPQVSTYGGGCNYGGMSNRITTNMLN